MVTLPENEQTTPTDNKTRQHVFSDEVHELKLRILAGVLSKSVIPDSSLTWGTERGRERHSRMAPKVDDTDT